ncbi:MAG: NADP-dependent isocitrate dehydrogenase [Spirochaetales bacterium]|nr:NADP-dependent isocitrate dehydrogenase [Spirochaetales bacterium]
MAEKSIITYTLTDEAPALATRSLLPLIRAFAGCAGIGVETKDISLAGRILAAFPERLKPEQRIPDDLALLGKMVKEPEANIIKLPNISASVPQLKAAVAELQEKGYDLPDYPEEPVGEEESAVRARYDKIKGSAVNPVLREGNSDRRAPLSVKNFARKNPHSMGAWSKDSLTHVASMEEGDFYGSEKSLTLEKADRVRIELKKADGTTEVLKEGLALLEGEIIDAAVMDSRKLREFYAAQIKDAREKGVLFSLHLKATMMKVSDPVIFGHALSVYFAPLFEKFGKELAAAGVDPNNGLGDLLKKIESLNDDVQRSIRAELDACLAAGPDLAMVDSDRGITNFHVPSDIIIDASMPAAIRNSGKMWNKEGKAQDMKAVIPDRSYAGVYQAAVDFCRENGAFDPVTMGSVANVGLMAQKAEEYGSHDKTFIVSSEGTVRVVGEGDRILLEQPVRSGDIFRMCQAKDAPIRDWIKLAVIRARLTGSKTIFWLDENRAHDRALREKVAAVLPEYDTQGLDISVLSPVEATQVSMKEIAAGNDVISVTGNVLRDYLTDLFPILEVGTSAKMLSVVPLMNGGGLYETGAGGSAPKHVQQFLSENHLRWDSLGEFLALAVSLEQIALGGNGKAAVLSKTLDQGTSRLLDNRKSPSRKAGELDNRGSHFYLALYWAQALAEQNDDGELRDNFAPLYQELAAKEEDIVEELNRVQGKGADMDGYYRASEEVMARLMRPSPLFNSIMDEFSLRNN